MRRTRGGIVFGALLLFASMAASFGAITGVYRAGFHSASSKTNFDFNLKGQVTNVPGWELKYSEGDALYRAGKYDDAYKRWAECLAMAESEGGAENCDSAKQIDLLQKLAIVYKSQGKPLGAVSCYQRAVVVASALYGKDDSRVAALMLDLGRMYTFYDGSKNYARANEILDEAFRINEKLSGKYSIPTGDVAIALAQLKQKESQYEKAVEFFLLAVEIGNRLEPNLISCCRIGPRQGLADSYEKLGEFEEALKVHKELIAMARAGALNMLPTLAGNYAGCLQKMGRNAEAQAVVLETKLSR